MTQILLEPLVGLIVSVGTAFKRAGSLYHYLLVSIGRKYRACITTSIERDQICNYLALN